VDFAEGFIPGTINIQGNNSFATWAGWFLKYDEPFILLAAPETLEDLTRKLMRIGLDNVMGYIPSTDVYTQNGGKLSKVRMTDIEDVRSHLGDSNVQIVDLRGVSEYNAAHIDGADNVFVGTLPDNLDKISRDKKVIIHCQGGDRASIGYSILEKAGFTNVVNYSPGMNEWIAYQTEEAGVQ
jgi:hydroxyacylglutathione hydrolase